MIPRRQSQAVGQVGVGASYLEPDKPDLTAGDKYKSYLE